MVEKGELKKGEFKSESPFLKEQFADFALFFISGRVGYKFLSPVFSFPTLKKSESLFHKEPIALVFEKVKRAICSFCSIHSFF